MMEDIEAGHIDCVIVKDLSRLGRDYIEAGRLIQKIFPAFSVRFIALNDNFDSLTADFNEKNLVLPVKNFVNDAYCSDISRKVRSHQQVKRERGDFIGAFAVYGYRKDPENINHLLVDRYAAGIVKKIFAWKIAGYSNLAIAEKLNRMGILSPMEYKKSQGEKFSTGFVTHVKAKWSAVAVKRILANELYTGVMVQGKSEKASHKVKHLVEKPTEKWVRVADTHEAVVLAEDFETVQKLLAAGGRASAGKTECHMFTGFLYCGDCGKPMIRRVNHYKGAEKIYFICPARNKGLGCTRHSIPEQELKHIVLAGLQQQLALFLDKSRVLAQIGKMEIQLDGVEAFDREIQRLNKEQEKFMSLRTGLYEDLKQGIITEEDFRDFRQIYETQYQAAEEAIRQQEEAIKELFKAGVSAGANLEKMKSTLEITELDRDILVTFISRILVYEDKRVFLELRARDMFAKVLMLADYAENKEQQIYTAGNTNINGLAGHFRVGIYARLSVENNERKNESIDTQIAIAKQYLKEHPEMELYNCYTDLGRTGTDFKREGFERMMQDVRKKRIDCVIVKDLSRFGRNHIETGNYIQKIFPFMDVRFIALMDGIDTFDVESGTSEMEVSLKNLVNEMYARDIARKVKSSRRSSQEQGSYTGGLPPYGYQAEWVDGKKCLFICPETSGTVRDIYELFLSGKNMREIAGILYERGIHRPGVYRKTGHVYQQEGEVLEQWPTGTVKFILTNPVYVGCLVQGTTCEKQYKTRNRHDVDSGDYCIRHGTHEPIISEDMFFRVAAMFEKPEAKYCNTDGCSKKVPLEEDIYACVLFCGDCGKRMSRVANAKQLGCGDMVRHYGYYCPASHRMDDLQCPAKSISMSVLDELVKTALHQEFALSDLRPGRLVKEYERQTEGQKQQVRQKIAWYEKQQESGKKRGSELYLKYHSGSLSLREFQQMKKKNEKSFDEVSERKEELQCRLDSMEREIKEKGKFLRNFMKCNEKTKLIKDVIHTLISRIDVYAGHRVKITFAFRMNDLLVKGAEKNEKNKTIRHEYRCGR